MKVTARKNQKLIKEYPFIGAILTRTMMPFAPEVQTHVDDLTIKVEIADGDLMYRKGKNYGLAENSGSLQYTAGRNKGQVAKQGEYLFAIDGSGQIINRVDWPRDRDDRKIMGNPYGYYALWKERDGKARMLSGSLYKETEFLVWVRVHARYDDTKDYCRPFGTFRGRDLTITIYKKPAIGFEQLQHNASVWKNLVLTSDVLMEALFDKDEEVRLIDGSLIELAQIFWEEVYDNGVQEIIDADEKFKVTLKAQYGNVKFVAGDGICGYKGVTLEDDHAEIAFNQRPEADCFYVGSVHGTLPQLRRLVLTVVNYWNHVSGARDQLVRSR